MSSSNFSISNVSTYKGLTALIVVMTCITAGHLCTCVNKTVIYLFTFYPSSILRQLESFPAILNPTQACHNRSDKPCTPLPSSPFSISLTFIFTLIELNKKIMFDIKSLWTCGPADHCVCLFFHSKCLFCQPFVYLLALLGSLVPEIADLQFAVSICFELTLCCCYAVRRLRLYFI